MEEMGGCRLKVFRPEFAGKFGMIKFERLRKLFWEGTCATSSATAEPIPVNAEVPEPPDRFGHATRRGVMVPYVDYSSLTNRHGTHICGLRQEDHMGTAHLAIFLLLLTSAHGV